MGHYPGTLVLDVTPPAACRGCGRIRQSSAPRPGLFSLRLRPGNRLPIRRKDQARAGIGDLDPVARRLVDIKKERLLDSVLVRAGFDSDAVFQENIRRLQDLLALIDDVGHMVKPPAGAGMVL